MRDEFEQAALVLYHHQRDRVPAYDAWCRHELAQRGSDRVERWQDVPALPIAAFRQLDVFDPNAPATAEWHSSGTTSDGERPSRHRLAEVDTYDAAIDEGVAAAVMPDVARGERDSLACVQLQPTRAAAPNSSLSHMFDRIRTGPWCRDAGVFVSGGYEVDVAGAWARLRELERAGEPVLLLATSFALVLLLDGVGELELGPVELAPTSRIVDTGGFKGRSRELVREELVARSESWIGVPGAWQENEYGMSELSSQAWLGTIADSCGWPLPGTGGEARWLPSTLRVRVVDPTTLEEVADGERGLLVFHDVANVHSCAAVRSEDIGIRRGASFELVGRAPGAALKGCSLRLEDMT